MTVESATYIDDLNATYPLGTDPKSEGDDHIRLIKSALKSTFPNVTGAVTPTHTEMNYLAGVTSGIQAQINAVATDVLFPNVDAAVTATDEELSFCDGVTSAIQTQLDNRLKLVSTTDDVLSGVTTLAINRDVFLGAGKTIRSAETIGAAAWPDLDSLAIRNAKSMTFAANNQNSGTALSLDLGLYPLHVVQLTGSTTLTLTATAGGSYALPYTSPREVLIVVRQSSESTYSCNYAAADGFTLAWAGGSAPGSLAAGDIHVVRVMCVGTNATLFLASFTEYAA